MDAEEEPAEEEIERRVESGEQEFPSGAGDDDHGDTDGRKQNAFECALHLL